MCFCSSSDVGGPADPIAPSIIIPPRNTSVMVGTFEVTLECVANARCVCVCVYTSTQNDLYQTIKTQFCLFVSFRPLLSLIPRLCLSVFLSLSTSRPLIKLSITWRKNGVLVNRGLRDFGRRLTISGPLVSDSGYYECEASLRSSSAPSVSAGAYVHVLGNLMFLLLVKTVFKMCLVQKVFKVCIIFFPF